MQSANNATAQSLLDADLTVAERRVLATYRSPASSDMRRQVRLSAQYAIGTGILVYLSISTGQPIYVVGVYVVFLLWMVVRLLGASRIVGVMSAIIEKYEARIATLQAQLNHISK